MTPGYLAAVAGAAAVLSCALNQLLWPIYRRYALARPNARSSHRTPTPQGGGIGVLVATLVCAGGGLSWWGGVLGSALPLLGLASLALAVIGGLDDVRPLGPGLRLAVQIAAVAAVVIWAMPGRIMPDVLPLWAERTLTILAGIWWVNLVNFMDGIDWITVAEIVPVTAALAIFGLLGFVTPPGAVLAAALCGALLGFAPFNRPVARLFLGDVGSLPVGLLSGWLLADLAASGALAAALLLPMYYLADATVTLLMRLRRGERIWEAHRSHFYQQALDHGHSVTAVDARVGGLNLLLAALAAATAAAPGIAMTAAALGAGGVLTAATLRGFARRRTERSF